MLQAIARVSIALFGLCFFLYPKFVSAQIAPGVTQSAAHTANITGTVVSSTGAPVSGAAVRLSGTSVRSTESDVHGVFSFSSVPWGSYEIVVTSTLGTVSRANITLGGDINIAIQYQALTQLHTIAHVSTSSAGAHINITSSSIESVNPSQYAFQGNTTWKELLAQVPGVAVSGYTAGGALYNGDIPGEPEAPVILSVNGALPYETSTTLDGMPLQGTSNTESYVDVGGGTDLSVLPLNAFDTADVVRGPGANAPSIVDSIGGSFVLHAPGQVTEDHFEFSVSNDPYGGIVSNAKAALRLGRLSATLIYGVNDSPGPLGADAKVISAFPPSGPLTIDGQNVWSSVGGQNANAPGIPNCYCSATDSLLIGGVPQSTAWTQHNGAVALSYNVTRTVTAQVFYAGTTSQQNAVAGYFPVDFAPSMAATPPYSGSIAPSPGSATNYNFLAGLQPDALYSVAASLLEEKVTAYLGNGVLRLAALQNNSYSHFEYGVSYPNGNYPVWGTACVGPTSPGTLTAYDGTTESLTFSNPTLRESFSSKNRDLLGSYAVQISPSSSLGISYLSSYYNDPYALALLIGNSVAFGLNQASAVSETTNETRLHFDTDISNRLSLGLSWYLADGTYHVPVPSNPIEFTNVAFPYSAPRFGMSWHANSDTVIRAAAGGGFALPALYDLTGYSQNFIGYGYSETIANLSLKPETAFGFDIGTDVRLHRDTVLSFDLYRTNLFGQFFQSQTISTFNGLPLYITQFGNIATSRYEGINLDVHHDVPAGYYWRGTLGFARAYVISTPAGFYNQPSVPCTNCINQYVVPGINFTSAGFDVTVPYTSASAQLGYRWSAAKYLDLSSTYYGSNNIYNVPAFVELDAQASYPITKNVSLLATFSNITGAYDESIENFGKIGYLTPVISGSSGYWTTAAMETPYGPRSLILTLNWH